MQTFPAISNIDTYLGPYLPMPKFVFSRFKKARLNDDLTDRFVLIQKSVKGLGTIFDLTKQLVKTASNSKKLASTKSGDSNINIEEYFPQFKLVSQKKNYM